MRTILLVVTALAAAACASDHSADKPADKSAGTRIAPPTDDPPGPPPTHRKNGLDVPLGTSKPRLPCSAEIDIHCPDGYEDGCVGDRTTSIVCVKKGAKALVPCDRQIVTQCPLGEINSCWAEPPYGTLHICVRP